MQESKSIVDYFSEIEEVPPLLDLSMESAHLPSSATSTHRNSKEHHERTYINSIYIQDEEDLGKPFGNNFSGEETQVPEFSNQLSSIQFEPSRFSSMGKMSMLALQTFQNVMKAPSRKQQFARTGTNQQLGSLFTSPAKLQLYILSLREMILELKNRNTNWNSFTQQHESIKVRQRQIETLNILICLLIKSQGNLEISHNKNGQFEISPASENKKSEKLQRLSKYTLNNPIKLQSPSVEQNTKKLKDLNKRLQEQDSLLERIKCDYDQIINNYAVTVKNLLQVQRKGSINNSSRNERMETKQLLLRKEDRQFEEIIKNSHNIDPQSIFNRVSQESKMRKSRPTSKIGQKIQLQFSETRANRQ